MPDLATHFEQFTTDTRKHIIRPFLKSIATTAFNVAVNLNEKLADRNTLRGLIRAERKGELNSYLSANMARVVRMSDALAASDTLKHLNLLAKLLSKENVLDSLNSKGHLPDALAWMGTKMDKSQIKEIMRTDNTLWNKYSVGKIESFLLEINDLDDLLKSAYTDPHSLEKKIQDSIIKKHEPKNALKIV